MCKTNTLEIKRKSNAECIMWRTEAVTAGWYRIPAEGAGELGPLAGPPVSQLAAFLPSFSTQRPSVNPSPGISELRRRS